MYLSRRNLECHVAAKYNFDKLALKNIALTPEGTVSCDRHLLLIVPYPQVDLATVPTIKGIEHEPLKDGEMILLDSDDAVRAAAMAPKKPYRPELGLLHLRRVKNSVKIGSNDGQNVQIMSAKVGDGEYPKYREHIPDYTDAKTVEFSVELLFKALKTLNTASGKDATVKFSILDGSKLARFITSDGVTLYIAPYGEPKTDAETDSTATENDVPEHQPIETEAATNAA
ncbi:MAG: hypothetical protein L6Q71_09615 [Planctomycetes bacterium]|nr:hypothetical protein [Planctomycetota bacterium]NUQ35402.1 hypothetical protein [Planctomycetaceae bacterium]